MMKKVLLAAFLFVPALPNFAENVPANAAISVPATQKISVLVVVRDMSGKNSFCNALESASASVSGVLAAAGIATQSTDFLKGETTQDAARVSALAALSPAEAADLSGADYALVIQLPAPVETTRSGTVYSRQNAFYTLYSFDGTVAASGRVSRIFSAPTVDNALRELRGIEAAEVAAAELEEKILSGKIVLKKAPPAQTGEVEIVARVESMTFPLVVENKDGTFSLAETQGSATLPGATLKIGGVDYTLLPGGSPTKLKLPIGRALFVRVSHSTIEPLIRTVKISKAGEKIILPLTLSAKTRERWKADAAVVSEIVTRARSTRKLTDAEAERLRGIAKFWENSGMKISRSTTQKFSHETKSELVESDVPSEK